MEYDYGFEYGFPDAVEGAAVGAMGIVTGIILIIYFLLLGVSVVSYVLGAVSMYRVAKRRGIYHAWLAWIPVGCNWLLGSISDHYQYVAKQKVTKRRKILLILSLIQLALVCLFAVGMVVMALSANTTGAMSSAILAAALMVISYLCMLGISIAILVFCYIAYYDLFQSCKPESAVLFLVLGILFSVTMPFFVFFGCRQDKGMPARRTQQPPEQIPYEPEAPAAPAEEEIPVVETEVVEDSE